MILADTSIWVDHLRTGDPELARALGAGSVVCHPYVIAELALGTLKARAEVLGLLDGLPALPVATVDEVRAMIEARGLAGRGIGFVDAGLVAAWTLLNTSPNQRFDDSIRSMFRDGGFDGGAAGFV